MTLNDLEKAKESARKRAERRWKNHALAKKYKENSFPVSLIVEPECIDWDNYKVNLKKEAQPELASIVPSNEAEEKLVRDRKQKALRKLFSFLYEDMARKKLLVKVSQPKPLTDEEMRRRLMLEKIRRLEASIAQREMGARK